MWLCGGDFSEANFAKADLSDAWLVHSQGFRAVFRDAVLAGAHLESARFEGADFRGADFHGADLNDTDMRYALLPGADFSGVDLTPIYRLQYAALAGIKFDRTTLELFDDPHDLLRQANPELFDRLQAEAVVDDLLARTLQSAGSSLEVKGIGPKGKPRAR